MKGYTALAAFLAALPYLDGVMGVPVTNNPTGAAVGTQVTESIADVLTAIATIGSTSAVDVSGNHLSIDIPGLT